MAKKPDRFEREVYEHNGLESNWMRAVDVVNLLRAQHRAVVRMLRKDIDEYKGIVAKTDVVSDAHLNALAGWAAVRKILDQLTKRAK